MNRQRANLCLIVVLVSAWTNGLMGASFLVAPQEDNSFLGQETYPLALRNRAENGLTVEAPALRSPDQATLVTSPAPPGGDLRKAGTNDPMGGFWRRCPLPVHVHTTVGRTKAHPLALVHYSRSQSSPIAGSTLASRHPARFLIWISRPPRNLCPFTWGTHSVTE
jgi:hypothetical protein